MTSRFAEFEQTTPTTDATDLLLPPGYITALDMSTGNTVVVPVHEPPATPQPQPAPAPQAVPELTALEKALLYAHLQPEPIPSTPPPPTLGVNPLVWQSVVVAGAGSLVLLAAGGAVYIVCEGLHVAGPWFADATTFLKWAALVLAAAVVACVVAARKLKSAMTTAATGDGQVVNALFYKNTEVNIGKQSAGWKGNISNQVK